MNAMLQYIRLITYSLIPKISGRVLVIFGVLALGASPLSAESQPSAIKADIAAYEFPPLFHTPENGEVSGTLGESIKRICEEGGLTCRFRMYPVTRAYDTVISGVAALTISGKHPRFESCCTASDWGYPWGAGLFSLLPKDQIPTTEAEMIGRSVIIVRGWRSPYRFMPNLDKLVAEEKITVFYTDSSFSAIRMLESGRADLMWGSSDFLWYVKKMKVAVKFSFSELIQTPVVLWANDTSPEIIDALNRGFRKLRSEDLLDDQNLLIPALMKALYLDAPLIQTQ